LDFEGASRHHLQRYFNMTKVVTHATEPTPQDDLITVVESRTREWHFHIYFLLQSPAETAAALALRDAVLRLRRDGKLRQRDHGYKMEESHLLTLSYRRIRRCPTVQGQ
jgi:hypothetical protein